MKFGRSGLGKIRQMLRVERNLVEGGRLSRLSRLMFLSEAVKGRERKEQTSYLFDLEYQFQLQSRSLVVPPVKFNLVKIDYLFSKSSKSAPSLLPSSLIAL